MSGEKRKFEDRDTLDRVDAPDPTRKFSRLDSEVQENNTLDTEDKDGNAQSSGHASGTRIDSESELSLAALLDFSALSTTEEISERFKDIAEELLCNTILTVVRDGTRTDLDILELEFYLQKVHCHEDPFTHGSVEQERSGQWYFHRSPRRAETPKLGLPVIAAGGYRGGTRKGLDLTVGAPCIVQTSNTPVTVRGGALLRTIRRRTDNQVVCGPSLLVDEILRLSGAPSIHHLVNTTWNGDISALSPPLTARDTFMYLQTATKNTLVGKRPTVYRSPRIGLDLSHSDVTPTTTHPRVIFVGKPYRYFIHPELLSSKGRMQSFVGLYIMLRESKVYPEDSMELKKALQNILRLGDQSLSKYLADYRSGYQVGKLKSFTGSAGRGVCQSASQYLKMMGTLHKALR